MTARRVWTGLIALLWTGICASTIPAAEGDGILHWLSQPAASRQAAVDAQPAPGADRLLAAWLDLLRRPQGQPRLAAAQRLLESLPAHSVPGGHLRLLIATNLAAVGRQQEAFDLAGQVRDAAVGDARLRYEACRVLANALAALGRAAEATASRREAADLIRTHLYTDSGVDARDLANDALADADPVPVYREAETRRQAGVWVAASALYRQVGSRFPTHPLAAASVVGLGWCELGLGRLAVAERGWMELVAADPRGPYRGQALLALIDTALEEHADADLARTLVGRLTQSLAGPALAHASWEDVPRQLALRRMLLCLVRNDVAAARAEAVHLLADRSNDDDANAQPTGAATFIPARGVGRLMEILANGEPLTPPAALTRRQQVNLRLVLADAWIALEVLPRARAHLVAAQRAEAGATPAQVAYAAMRLADCERADNRFDQFRSGYEAVLAASPRNPWAPAQRLALAVDTYGRLGRMAEAVSRLRELVADMPQADHSRSAAYYLGLIPFWEGRWQEADAAWADLDRGWPGHPWRDVIEGSYRPMLRDAQKTGRWPAGLPEAAPTTLRKPVGR